MSLLSEMLSVRRNYQISSPRSSDSGMTSSLDTTNEIVNVIEGYMRDTRAGQEDILFCKIIT